VDLIRTFMTIIGGCCAGVLGGRRCGCAGNLKQHLARCCLPLTLAPWFVPPQTSGCTDLKGLYVYMTVYVVVSLSLVVLMGFDTKLYMNVSPLKFVIDGGMGAGESCS